MQRILTGDYACTSIDTRPFSVFDLRRANQPMATPTHPPFSNEKAESVLAANVGAEISVDRTATLISAGELPSAAASLAELFPTEAFPAEDSLDQSSEDSDEALRKSSSESSPGRPDEASLDGSDRPSLGNRETSSLCEPAEQVIALVEVSLHASEELPAVIPAGATSADEARSVDPTAVGTVSQRGTLLFLSELPAGPAPPEPSADGGVAGAVFDERLARHREW